MPRAIGPRHPNGQHTLHQPRARAVNLAALTGGMQPAFYLADRSAVADAFALMREHGDQAAGEARLKAHASRGIGNHIHFCRWRQVARLIALLDGGAGGATLH